MDPARITTWGWLFAAAVAASGAAFAVVQAEPAAQLREDGDAGDDAARPRGDQHEQLPAGAVARLGSVRFRHAAFVRGVGWLPDGSGLLAADSAGALRRWDPATGLELSSPRDVGGQLQSMSLSPDGGRVATGHSNGSVHLFDVGAAGEPAKLDVVATSVRFSPDGEWLAVWISATAAEFIDEALGVTLLDGRGEKPVARIEMPVDVIVGTSFSADGEAIAVAGNADRDERALKGLVRLADATSGELVRDIALDEWLSAVLLPPGDAHVYVGTGSGLLLQYDRVSGEETARWAAHAAPITALAASPDGSLIASAGKDGTVALRERETGEVLHALPFPSGPVILDLEFSPSGDRLAAGGSDRLVHLWVTDTGEELVAPVGHRAAVSSVACSPDGSRSVTGGFDGRVCVWNAATSAMEFRLEEHIGFVRDVACSPDGQLIASVGDDAAVHLWELATGEHVGRCGASRMVMTSVAFAPDSGTVASAGQDTTVRTWDVESREPRLVLETGRLVHCVAYSPDGALLVGGTSDVLVWNAQTGELVRTIKGTSPIQSLVISADGTRVATANADRTVRVYSVETGNEQLSIPGHAGRVEGLAFSPDGTLIASSDQSEPVVRLWDAQTGESLGEFSGHAEPILDLAFSPDGVRLSSVSVDGTGLVWAVPPRD